MTPRKTPANGKPPGKLRLLHVVVQPVLTYDDGETLTPGPPLGPQALPLDALSDFADQWPEQLAALQAHVER